MSERPRSVTPAQERRKARLLAQGERYQQRLSANATAKERLYARRRVVFLDLERCGALLAEIAKAFGVNESAVSQQLRRARDEEAGAGSDTTAPGGASTLA